MLFLYLYLEWTNLSKSMNTLPKRKTFKFSAQITLKKIENNSKIGSFVKNVFN